MKLFSVRRRVPDEVSATEKDGDHAGLSGASLQPNPEGSSALMEEFWDDLRLVLNSFNSMAAVTLSQAKAANRMNLKFDSDNDFAINITDPAQIPFVMGEVFVELRAIHPKLFDMVRNLVEAGPGDVGRLSDDTLLALKHLGLVFERPEAEQKSLRRQEDYRKMFSAFLDGLTGMADALASIFHPHDPEKIRFDREEFSQEWRRTRYSWNPEAAETAKAVMATTPL